MDPNRKMGLERLREIVRKFKNQYQNCPVVHVILVPLQPVVLEITELEQFGPPENPPNPRRFCRAFYIQQEPHYNEDICTCGTQTDDERLELLQGFRQFAIKFFLYMHPEECQVVSSRLSAEILSIVATLNHIIKKLKKFRDYLRSMNAQRREWLEERHSRTYNLFLRIFNHFLPNPAASSNADQQVNDRLRRLKKYVLHDDGADLDFVYNDTDCHQNEIAELYSYAEHRELLLNFQAFKNQMEDYHLPPRWQDINRSTQITVVMSLQDQLEFLPSDRRIKAARCILYIAQGCWAEMECVVEQQRWARFNAILLYRSGVFTSFVDLLNLEIENRAAAFRANQKKSTGSLADAQNLNVIVSVLYIITEVIRHEKTSGSLEYESFVNAFIAELAEPFPDDDKLLIVKLLNMVTSFCDRNADYFPIKKILLLIWKLILIFLGGMSELDEIKRQKRLEAGLDDDETLETTIEASSPRASEATGSVLKRKVRQKDIDRFLATSRAKFVKNASNNDDDRLAGLPDPICNAYHTMNRHKYTSLAEVQIKTHYWNPIMTKEQRASRNARTEILYHGMLPHLPEYIKALLKILLVAAPSTELKADYSVNIMLDALPNGLPTSTIDYMKIGVDINRHKEILAKAISAILFLLLKHLKLNHIYQFEYMSQHLVFANCIPVILKMFSERNSNYVVVKNVIPILEFPGCVIGEPDLTEGKMEFGDLMRYSWRNMFVYINLLRILNKLTKYKTPRIKQMLSGHNSHILFQRMVKIRHEMIQVYSFKLLKMQVKFLGLKWRTNNMATITAIYKKVRQGLIDDWAAYGDDALVESFESEECSLGKLINNFNFHTYFNHERIDFQHRLVTSRN